MNEKIAQLEARIQELENSKENQEISQIKYISPGNAALALAYTRTIVLEVGGQLVEIAVLK